MNIRTHFPVLAVLITESFDFLIPRFDPYRLFVIFHHHISNSETGTPVILILQEGKWEMHPNGTAYQWCTQEFCSRGAGVQQIQLWTEDRESGDLGAVAH